MNKLFKLAKSNINNGKGQTISFFFVILISAILLNLGFITALNFNKNYDEKFDKANAAHSFISMKEQDYNPKYVEYIENYKGINQVEKRSVKIANGSYLLNGSNLVQDFVIYDIEDETTLNSRNFIEKLESEPDNAIYLPLVVKTAGQAKLNDDFTITINNKHYTYTIAGFYEDFNTGRYTFQYTGITLSHSGYNSLKADNKDIFNGTILFSRMNDINDSEKFDSDLSNFIVSSNSEKVDIKGYTCYKTKSNAMVNPSIMMAVMIAFSLIIAIISLIIIKFKITNSIEEDMRNIGALKALGYTSNQLIASFIFQFSSVTLLGSIIGVALSFAILPTYCSMVTVNAGLVWKPPIDIISMLLTVSILVGSTILVSLFSALRIKKLPPVTALRDGITIHNFKKNFYPLDKKTGNINFLLAIKMIISNIKQNVMIVLIITAISFTSIFSIVIYRNMVTDNSAFCDMISGEFSSIMLDIGEGNYDKDMKSELLKQEGVRKVSFYDLMGKGNMSDGHSLMIFLSESFDDVENKKCYEGRDPKYDNEIVLNGILAERYNKTIGDTIKISFGNKSQDFLITGLMQSGNGEGYEAELTIGAYLKINPNYEMKKLNVYTNIGANVNEVLYDLQNHFGNTFSHYSNMDEAIVSMTRNFSQMALLMTIAILIITALVIALVVYLSVKALLIRGRKEFGIKKALGFTTKQLMLQTSLSFMPVVLIGGILGSMMGYFLVNPLLSIMMRGMGIVKVPFIVPILPIILACICICIFVFMVAMLISHKIKKISPYKLLS